MYTPLQKDEEEEEEEAEIGKGRGGRYLHTIQ
jgi:hypothetical protein